MQTRSMISADPHATEYYKYYKSQIGGQLPVFRGGQVGDGIGDIFKGIIRFITPYLFPVISSTIGGVMESTNKSLAEGRSTEDALRMAIRPGIASAFEGLTSTIRKRHQEQTGSGRKRKGKSHRKKRVYKHPKNKKMTKRHRTRRIKFAKSNF